MTDIKDTVDHDAAVAKQTFRALVLKSPITWVLIALVIGLVIGRVL